MPNGYLKNMCGHMKKGGHTRGLSFKKRRGGASKGSAWNNKGHPVTKSIAELDTLGVKQQLEYWDKYPSVTDRYRAGMLRSDSSFVPKCRRKPMRKGGKAPKYF